LFWREKEINRTYSLCVLHGCFIAARDETSVDDIISYHIIVESAFTGRLNDATALRRSIVNISLQTDHVLQAVEP